MNRYDNNKIEMSAKIKRLKKSEKKMLAVNSGEPPLATEHVHSIKLFKAIKTKLVNSTKAMNFLNWMYVSIPVWSSATRVCLCASLWKPQHTASSPRKTRPLTINRNRRSWSMLPFAT